MSKDTLLKNGVINMNKKRGLIRDKRSKLKIKLIRLKGKYIIHKEEDAPKPNRGR